jgi:Leucine Rich repeat
MFQKTLSNSYSIAEFIEKFFPTPGFSDSSSSQDDTSSSVSASSSSVQDSTSEEDSEKSAQAPKMKSKQPGEVTQRMADQTGEHGGEAPQAYMTGTLPVLTPRLTQNEKRARYRQARNEPSYQRKTEINKIKKVTKSSAANIPLAPIPQSRRDRFTQLIKENGELCLNDNDVIDINGLAKWLRSSPKDLLVLEVNDIEISDADAILLADAIKQNTSIIELRLICTGISAAGAKALADALKVNKTLKELYIGANKIGAKGAIRIANALKVNTTLSGLCLAGNNITNSGARRLAEILEFNSTLTRLNLMGNGIDDTGVAALAKALKSNKALTILNIESNPIGSEGVKALADALSCNQTLAALILTVNGEDSDKTPLIDVLKFNETLTTLKVGDLHDPKLKQEMKNRLDRNQHLRFVPYAEASLDLIFQHSPTLSKIGMPKELLLLIARELSNQVLAQFANEWESAFRLPQTPVLTTTTNTTTTTTTTTTNPTATSVPVDTSRAVLTTAPASASLPMAEPTATANDINALLASPNPVKALSDWIDGHANPATALHWVDPANGYTLLHYAAEAQEVAVARNLIARGIDRTKVNHNQQTAAQLAKQKVSSSSSQNAAKIVQLLE